MLAVATLRVAPASAFAAARMSPVCVALVAAALCATGAALDTGRSKTPPAGWRSWNFFGSDVDQSLIESIMDGIAARTYLLDGVPTSLADLGFSDVGLDGAHAVSLSSLAAVAWLPLTCGPASLASRVHILLSPAFSKIMTPPRNHLSPCRLLAGVRQLRP